MTRIVAGTAGGRRLRVPPAGTRPTSDRVREALFNLLAARMDFDGVRVLDLYAGSGALGLEALSRGASHALLVESDRKAATIIRGNISDLGLPGADLRMNTVAGTLGRNAVGALALTPSSPPGGPYDLVFSDPPYAVEIDEVIADLAALAAGGWLHEGALIVVERSTRSPELAWPEGYSPLKSRTYGETRLDLAEYEP
ncbi:16S rRNA (guanine(966)-N(2))-methyltransferase RsmD [Nocardia sp. SYP-A9097]|uniref:16S rRNA (guanine(966)-N(2))-methyltransferase RsmD n=1 Tax=Nocardia sp. SYP-A9097 TaxID=2663237 RepID=UPI00129B2C61|nr:16S rRNA (guanine(966)-N(2))-methyltransferase RsmD [Nocardia sp. SYP-A9097]MRH91012.1 16S rRNA (guanine(966)-N(2))-methyltransferase RsmD [Nocardia sp. SYP-A9097]